MGTPPEITLIDALMDDVNAVVELSWGEEICEFETRKELNQFISKLKEAGKKAFKPLIKIGV